MSPGRRRDSTLERFLNDPAMALGGILGVTFVFAGLYWFTSRPASPPADRSEDVFIGGAEDGERVPRELRQSPPPLREAAPAGSLARGPAAPASAALPSVQPETADRGSVHQGREMGGLGQGWTASGDGGPIRGGGGIPGNPAAAQAAAPASAPAVAEAAAPGGAGPAARRAADARVFSRPFGAPVATRPGVGLQQRFAGAAGSSSGVSGGSSSGGTGFSTAAGGGGGQTLAPGAIGRTQAAGADGGAGHGGGGGGGLGGGGGSGADAGKTPFNKPQIQRRSDQFLSTAQFYRARVAAPLVAAEAIRMARLTRRVAASTLALDALDRQVKAVRLECGADAPVAAALGEVDEALNKETAAEGGESYGGIRTRMKEAQRKIKEGLAKAQKLPVGCALKNVRGLAVAGQLELEQALRRLSNARAEAAVYAGSGQGPSVVDETLDPAIAHLEQSGQSACAGKVRTLGARIEADMAGIAARIPQDLGPIGKAPAAQTLAAPAAAGRDRIKALSDEFYAEYGRYETGPDRDSLTQHIGQALGHSTEAAAILSSTGDVHRADIFGLIEAGREAAGALTQLCEARADLARIKKSASAK